MYRFYTPSGLWTLLSILWPNYILFISFCSTFWHLWIYMKLSYLKQILTDFNDHELLNKTNVQACPKRVASTFLARAYLSKYYGPKSFYKCLFLGANCHSHAFRLIAVSFRATHQIWPTNTDMLYLARWHTASCGLNRQHWSQYSSRRNRNAHWELSN